MKKAQKENATLKSSWERKMAILEKFLMNIIKLLLKNTLEFFFWAKLVRKNALCTVGEGA
jgi:hypothetical protein